MQSVATMTTTIIAMFHGTLIAFDERKFSKSSTRLLFHYDGTDKG
jgi:hypothetical protein